MELLVILLIALAAGIVPMVVYGLILWWFDRYEKEPVGLLIAAFLWGAVPAIVFSLIAQFAFDYSISSFVEPGAADLIGTVIGAPITEEIFKGGALLVLLFFFRREIDSPLDGIIYGGLVGFGFAAVENVLYFVGGYAEAGGESLVFMMIFRAFLFGLNHALFTGLTGFGLALARTSPNWLVKIGAPITGLALGMVAHGVHNWSVSFPEQGWPCLVAFASNWGWTFVMLVVIIWTSLKERQWIRTYLADEVERGTMTRGQYVVVSSYWQRVAERWGALFGLDVRRWWALGRYYRMATKLAFGKYRLSRFPHEQDTRARLVQLQRQVAEMGARLAS